MLSTVGNAEFLSLHCLQPNSHIGKLEDLTMDYSMRNFFFFSYQETGKDQITTFKLSAKMPFQFYPLKLLKFMKKGF